MDEPIPTTNSLNRQILKLSLPLAGTQLANIALATTDTLIIGQLGLAALAGGGLAVVWFNQIRTMAVGLLTPLGNRIAEAHARYERSLHNEQADKSEAESLRGQIRNLARVGLLLATISGIIGAALLVAISYLLTFFGQSSETASTAQSMMWLLAPGLIPCLWFQVSRQFCIGLSKPRSLLHITLAMVVINAILSYVLAFGFGPVPRMGVMGVGLATTVVHLFSSLAYLRIINSDRELSEFHATDFWHAESTTHETSLWRPLKTQLRLGLPVSATYGAEAGMFSALAMVMGFISTEALAAHNVVYQVTFIVFQIGVGFSHGSSILVSRAWGVGDTAFARNIGLRAWAMTAGVVAVAAVFFVATPELILRPFLAADSASTMSLAIGLLAIGALMEFVDTAQNVAIGTLRGIGDTTTGLKASLIGYWIVGLPAALLLAFPLDLGAYGIWWGLVIGLATSATLLWSQFIAKTKAG